MINIDIIKKTFCIYPYNDIFRVSITYKKQRYSKIFETEEECNNYIKNIVGDEEYNKRNFEAFNYNFKKYIQDNNLLTEKQNQIWKKICEKYKGCGPNKSRKSHIEKIKTITLFDIYNILERNNWTCYYSKLNFDINISYLSPSIERIDSQLGYIKDNCVIVLEFCQNLKNAYSLEEFKRCIISISTGIIQEDHDETIKNNLIGGGKKKGLKKWKQIDLSKPLRMSKIEYYIYEILKNTNEYISRIEITNLILTKYNLEVSKGGLHFALNKMLKNKYVIVDKNHTIFKYKLETSNNIKKINKDINITCGFCKNKFNILEFRARDARGNNVGINLNLCHTVCSNCNTSYTNKYKNKDIETFILRQISGRTMKKGNVTKENIKKIKGIDGKCAITGMPLIANNNTEKFNQASPDRIDNNNGYNIDNIRIICLALNFAKNNYNISDDTILNIIKNIYYNISNINTK